MPLIEVLVSETNILFYKTPMGQESLWQCSSNPV